MKQVAVDDRVFYHDSGTVRWGTVVRLLPGPPHHQYAVVLLDKDGREKPIRISRLSKKRGSKRAETDRQDTHL